MGNKPRIGIVLAKTPGYSETFLVNKIEGLVTGGFEVTLFTDRKSNKPYRLCREYTAYTLPQNVFFRSIKVIAVLFLTFMRTPFRTVAYYHLERTERKTWNEFLKTIFRSSHMLGHTLDYLHFGFTTLAVGRENLGIVLKAKVSSSFRGYDIGIFPLKNPFVYNELWKKLDKAHTISKDLHHKALALGLPRSIPVVKIPPAIDVRKFLFPDRQPINNTELKILTIGRLEWKKGLEVAIDAMTLLKTWNIKFKYTIVGAGSEMDRLLFNRHQNKLAEQIQFVGVKRQDEIISIMKEHDVYIQPSLQEGFCNAVLEAQANGLLCIVSDAEGLSENVLHNETGWVLPRGNPQILANKIREVMNLPFEVIQQMQDRAIGRVKRDFDLPYQRQQFIDFFSR